MSIVDKRKKAALEYHSAHPAGKLGTVPTKPFRNQEDLSLAYTPGVAEPCLEIAKDVHASYKYTNRGNLVGVISNGTAVLGLGDIGATASKPVLEGKAVLFKAFAGIDVFDIEIRENDPDKFVEIVKSLEPTFGGINLEDIKAPECFRIEERLCEETNVPVFHDDQHGTALITTAALMNALELVDKKALDIKVVFSGAGAAGVACAKMAMQMGVPKENIFMTDRLGLVTTHRPSLEPHRGFFAQDAQTQSLEEVMRGADVFIGVSAKGLVTPAMLKSMAKNPIVFAMANPDPEISYEDAIAARSDVIMATGRSDYPNQVNNVLGFPFIFRGALDSQSLHINEPMKMAAAESLAKLAKEPVLPEVKSAYGNQNLEFGKDYLIPKPLDPRVLLWEAPAVVKAAMESGVAEMPIADLEGYRSSLEKYLDHNILFQKEKMTA